MTPRKHPENPAQTLMETNLMARLYESLLWRRNPLLVLLLGTTFDQEYRLVSRALKLTGSEAILDLACGPGIYTRRFARETGTVFGLDLSLPMLEQGKCLVQRNRLSNVRLIQGSAVRLPFRNSQFDAVNCAAALHLFGDLAGTFSEVSRVLKPGGRFTFSTFRYPKNRLVRLVLHLRANIVGIRSFRQEDIENELRRAGF
ncbi:MAG TPA: class I SAM-dependent methyltransferase, partial [Anaerolineales bacterium]|nr:class I SAM-dependent methyltransferase [Anaerolineales bacterium]